jgi:hypothetical protein
MQKTCRQCKSSFAIPKEDLNLYKKFETDPQDLCFDCDQKQRLCFRNERVLYNRKCDATGKNIISIYAPDSPYIVYDNEYWYGDKWDAMDYGRDFDFNRPFFEQFKELQLAVPRSPLINVQSENSDYCNMCVGNKNCYLIFGGDFNEDCLYGTLCMHNRDSLDIDYSKGCINCHFISDCVACNDCIFCVNLANKSFCIDNIQLTKEEYQKRKKEILNGSYRKQLENWQKFLKMRSGRVARYSHTLTCENCTGDYLKNCKNCQNAFDVSNSEDVRNCIFAEKAKDCFNVSLVGHESELVFNSIAIIGVSNVKFSYYIFGGANIEYSEQIISGQDLFGCEGLQHKKYCIFNKQYSKEEYFRMRAGIVEHMKKTGERGKFFPHDLSCFGHNEATGMRYYPLTKEQALKEGFKWKDEDPKNYKSQTYVIPDNIRDVSASITEETLACESCKKNFKIIAKELEFYRKQNIPVPHNCSDCRQVERFALRTPCKIYDRKCAKCSKEIKTTYAPGRQETVYCEQCYLKEVY